MLCLTHKVSINVAITALLFDLSVILYLLLSYLTSDWKSFPLPASGGLALALVQFFYVKYLVLFGLPSMLATLDGVLPPKLPRCVSIMHSFTEMWRWAHTDKNAALYWFLLHFFNISVSGKRSVLFIIEDKVNVRSSGSSARRPLAT